MIHPRTKALQIAGAIIDADLSLDEDSIVDEQTAGLPEEEVAELRLYLTRIAVGLLFAAREAQATQRQVPPTIPLPWGDQPWLTVVQDPETGWPLTLKVSPGEANIMIYCYRGEAHGAPLASLQIGPFQNRLEVLYWDAKMKDEEDPKRLVLAEEVRGGDA